MAEQTLRELLEKVRTELARGEKLDDNARRLLEAVDEDIEVALDRDKDNPPSLLDRLREAASEFEEQHPQFSASIRQAAETLEKMGL